MNADASPSMNADASPSRTDVLLLRAAMFASAGAAAIHLAAAHAHLLEWPLAGDFMIVSGFFQLAWIAWVSQSRSRVAVLAGVAGNAGVIALWIVSRTAGLPLGPMAGMPEHVHSPDLLATLLEALIVFAGVALLRPALPRPARRLMLLASTGSVLSLAVTSHEPLRERAVVLAALTMTAAASVVTPAVVRLIDRQLLIPRDPPRRTHAQASPVRRLPVSVDRRTGIAIFDRSLPTG